MGRDASANLSSPSHRIPPVVLECENLERELDVRKSVLSTILVYLQLHPLKPVRIMQSLLAFGLFTFPQTPFYNIASSPTRIWMIIWNKIHC